MSNSLFATSDTILDGAKAKIADALWNQDTRAPSHNHEGVNDGYKYNHLNPNLNFPGDNLKDSKD